MSAAPYYVTTAIPYVNARPHIGHALLLVLADTLARYHRLRGDDTRFLTGTDDNALTNVRAAEAAGLPVQELVDRNAAHFAALREPLTLSFDDFIRTSSQPRHIAGARKLWRACAAAGDIYRRHYQGLYCVGCERFYAEDELRNGRCPMHRRAPELVAEENFFFRLSRYGDQLADLIASDRLRIVPHTRRNEVLSFIASGLDDFSISRSQQRARGWGIPVPDDPTQVIYVWFDALTNYITALDYAADGPLYARYWRANRRRIHVIGKDLLRFHAVYWPAMLLSAGEPLPDTIYTHEFLTVNGEKISKSLGNAIDPLALVNQYGVDALRYWLLRDVPRTEDADFTVARLAARYETDLAHGLGNLLHRAVSMTWRYHDGRVPTPTAYQPLDQECITLATQLPAALDAALADFDFRAALSAIWAVVTRANQYVEQTAPWLLAQAARAGDTAAAQRLATVLYTLTELLRLVAHHLTPFLPGAAAAITAQLGLPPVEQQGSWSDAVCWGRLTPGARLDQPQPIFPALAVAR